MVRHWIHFNLVLIAVLGHFDERTAAAMRGDPGSSAGAAAATVKMNGVASSLDADNVSYIRILHTGVLANTATITLYDAAGTSLTRWTSPSIPPGSQREFRISDIEAAAIPPFTVPAVYSVDVDAPFPGYAQHVVHALPADTRTNLSACRTSTTAAPVAAGVYSSAAPTSVASRVVIANPGAAAMSYSLGVFDALTGSRLGTYTSPAVPPNGTVNLTSAAIESGASLPAPVAGTRYVLEIEAGAPGYLRHMDVYTVGNIVSDMTIACELSDKVSAVPSAPTRVGPVYSSTSAASKSILRFHNTSTTDDRVRVTLVHFDTGQQLAQWTSPVIPAGAQRDYQIAAVEAGAVPAFAPPAYYSLLIESRFGGYFQHLVRRPAPDTLTSLSSCDAGVKGDTTKLSGIFSSLAAVDYLSSIIVGNNSAAAVSPAIKIFDSQTGGTLGTYQAPSIAPNGMHEISVQALEAGITPVANGRYNLRIDGVFTGFLQHRIEMQSNGVRIDLTSACALEAKLSGPALRPVPASTVRVEQVIGQCDRQLEAQTGTCQEPASQTMTRYTILGTDLGQSFEDNGRLLFLFGDTIQNFGFLDTLAETTATDPNLPLVLDFLTDANGAPLHVTVPGTPMGAFNVPDSGISLPSGIYMSLNVGANVALSDPYANGSSKLVRFDPVARTFTDLRTVSAMPGGRFLLTSMRRWGQHVYVFGTGPYRASDVYLLRVPVATFGTGAGTEYFAGLAQGQPIWNASEAAAAPIVQHNPLNGPEWPNNGPSAGNISVTYAASVQRLLMTYDAQNVFDNYRGVWFSYAETPWGPWARPQLIFHPINDNARGVFIHDPSIVPDDGLGGPTPVGVDPITTSGGFYAPFMIERFTTSTANRLTIHYLMSTSNPYTTVRMKSEFDIVP